MDWMVRLNMARRLDARLRKQGTNSHLVIFLTAYTKIKLPLSFIKTIFLNFSKLH